MATPPAQLVARSRVRAGRATVFTALKSARGAGRTIDDLMGIPARSDAPPHLRKKPLQFVLRKLQLTQDGLAESAGISITSVNHACAGLAVHLSTLLALAEALQWPAHDVAEMIEAKPETLTAAELREILARVDGTLIYKAGMLNTTDRTLRRWMSGDRPIPAGLKEELATLGWC